MINLHEDTAHISALVLQDSKFSNFSKGLSSKEAAVAIIEAFEFMHRKEHSELTHKGCLGVCLLQQVLVTLFVKKVTKLLTAEAVILHQDIIPPFYLQNYIAKQAHFSLKKAITRYHEDITR